MPVGVPISPSSAGGRGIALLQLRADLHPAAIALLQAEVGEAARLRLRRLAPLPLHLRRLFLGLRHDDAHVTQHAPPSLGHALAQRQLRLVATFYELVLTHERDDGRQLPLLAQAVLLEARHEPVAIEPRVLAHLHRVGAVRVLGHNFGLVLQEVQQHTRHLLHDKVDERLRQHRARVHVGDDGRARRGRALHLDVRLKALHNHAVVEQRLLVGRDALALI
mmetsp:Transcript_44929/g.140738  ORF Transcript_44929/g.140738 Transcript_44929/m.140738 type:complete len:221 (-) Transcript_44929:731-1393(-)